MYKFILDFVRNPRFVAECVELSGEDNDFNHVFTEELIEKSEIIYDFYTH